MRLLTILPLIMGGVTALVGGYHLVIYVRRRVLRTDFDFALLCFAVAFYDVCAAGLYAAESVEQGAEWQRLQMLSLAGAGFFFTAFVSHYAGRRISLFPRSLMGGFLAMVLLYILDHRAWLWTLEPRIKELHLPFGRDAVIYEASLGLPGYVLTGLGAVAFGYAVFLGVQLYRRGSKARAVPLLVALVIFFASLFNDFAVTVGIYRFFYLTEYAFFPMVLMMAHALSVELAEASDVAKIARGHERRLESLIANVPGAVYCCLPDRRRTMVFLSGPFAEVTGYAPEEFVDNRVRAYIDIIHPDDREEVLDAIAAAVREGRPYSAEYRITHRSGEVRWVQERGRPLVHDTESDLHLDGVIIETTELNRTVSELQRYRDRLSTVLRTVPIPLFAKDREGRYIFFNPAFEDFFDIQESELLGKSAAEVWPREDADVYHDRDQELMETDGVQTYQHTLTMPDGEKRHVIFTKACFHDRDGEVAGLVGTFFDLTERMEAEEARRQLEEQLHHAQRMEALGRLAGGIAHDFNNLLTAIQGNAELIGLTAEKESETGELADEILEATTSAAGLTQQLLDYARRERAQSVPVDVQATVKQVTKLLRPSLGSEIEVDTQLTAENPMTTGDPGRLQTALLNLGINATDAMPEGGRLTFRVRNIQLARFRCEHPPRELPEGLYIEVSVSDTGLGIPPEIRQIIWEPFFTTKPRGKGTGLGLANVYACAESHNGCLQVESRPGKGSTFRLVLPVSKETAAD